LEVESRPLAVMYLKVGVRSQFMSHIQFVHGSYVPLRGGEDTDGNAIEPRNGLLTKDKICGTLDVRLGVHLLTSLGKDGVLETLELAAVVALLISVCAESNGLGARSARVDDVYVVDLEVCGPCTESGRLVVIKTIVLTLARRNGDFISGVAAGVGCLSIDSQGRFKSLDVDLFLICTTGDIDTLRSRGGGAQGVHGGLHGLVFAGIAHSQAAGRSGSASGARKEVKGCCGSGSCERQNESDGDMHLEERSGTGS
jgi:hypothetical protein